MPFNSFENYPMSWRPRLDRDSGCLYQALAGQLASDIEAGVLKPGTRLPPQRELADYLDINLSTVSKAFRLCGQKGLLSATVGSGTYVAYDALTSDRLLSEHRDRNVIDMGATVPATSGNEILTSLLREIVNENGSLDLFGYHLPAAHEWQKDAAVSLMRYCGHHTNREQILFANGGQSALTSVLAALFKRGDKIVVDDHTFPGIKSASSMLGIQLEPVPQDEAGMDIQALEYACKSKKIAGVYIVSACHNPTTVTMPQVRRREIAQIVKKYGCILIEDGTYHPMTEGMTSISDNAADKSVYIVSLSKAVAPGLRMAYLSAPPQYKTAIADALYTFSVAVVPIMAELAARLIVSGQFETVIKTHQSNTAIRNALVNRRLSCESCRGGGSDIFRWLLLPEKYTGAEFEQLALLHGVQVYAAEKFVVGKTPPARAVRLSICAPRDMEELERGVSTLKGLIGGASFVY